MQPQGTMAETSHSNSVLDVVKTLVGGVAAAFAFAEAVAFTLNPPLAEDGELMGALVLAAAKVGSTGVGAVAACLWFTSLLVSLGCGFLLAALAMKLPVGLTGLRDAMTGACVVLGGFATGVLGGVIPSWLLLSALGLLVVVVYSYSKMDEMTTALLIIFTTLRVSITYGEMGAMLGLILIGLTVVFLFIVRTILTKRMQRLRHTCRLLQRITLYSIFVATLGFFTGLGARQKAEGTAEEAELLVRSVLWVVFLSAGLVGAGLGTVAMVGSGPEVARNVAIAASVASLVALRAVACGGSVLGARASMGGTLGVATAAGVSLASASVGAKEWFKTRGSTMALLGTAMLGAILAARGPTVETTEVVQIILVVVVACALGAPGSPFHVQVNLRRGALRGADLISNIGMETVAAVAAPVGAGALGAAALGTAALGRLGTVGVQLVTVLAVGKTLAGTIGNSPSATHER